jgi:hypothetical protein
MNTILGPVFILSFAASTKAGQVSEDLVLVDITDKSLGRSLVVL